MTQAESSEEIPTHELDWPEPERELAMLSRLLDKAPSRAAVKQTNVGAAFDRTCKALGFHVSLGHAPAEVVAALRTVVEFGVALFKRGGFRPEQMVTITLRGQAVEVPGGVSQYTSAPRWAKAAGAAMAARDEAALQRLCEFDPRSFEGEYDAYHDLYAQAVIASVRGGDVAGLLAQAEAAARAPKYFPERAQRLGLPILAVARAALLGEADGYDANLAEGLRWYQTLHDRPPDNADAGAVVALVYLGLAARAHDRGIACHVRSGYLPAWLVEGAVP